MPNSKNHVEVYCFFESSNGAKNDLYEVSIRIGKNDFEQPEHYAGRTSAMRAAKRISAVVGLPVVENKYRLF